MSYDRRPELVKFEWRWGAAVSELRDAWAAADRAAGQNDTDALTKADEWWLRARDNVLGLLGNAHTTGLLGYVEGTNEFRQATHSRLTLSAAMSAALDQLERRVANECGKRAKDCQQRYAKESPTSRTSPTREPTSRLATTANSVDEHARAIKDKGQPMARPSVFICYAKQDSKKAGEIFEFLASAGADPWLDERKLVLGDDWKSEIEKAVANAAAFVVCLRPGFDDIGFRQKEVRWAIDAFQLRPPGAGFIIPFMIEPCDLPDWCKPFHAGADLSRQATLDELAAAVEKHCRSRLVRPGETPGDTGI